jgi:hypothetical protein
MVTLQGVSGEHWLRGKGEACWNSRFLFCCCGSQQFKLKIEGPDGRVPRGIEQVRRLSYSRSTGFLPRRATVQKPAEHDGREKSWLYFVHSRSVFEVGDRMSYSGESGILFQYQ